MNAAPPASPTPSPARDDLPDLDRLVQLACQTAGVSAALLVEWTLPHPQVLGRHGLRPDQTDAALEDCWRAVNTPELDACIPDMTAPSVLARRPHAAGPSAWRFLQTLALPSCSARASP